MLTKEQIHKMLGQLGHNVAIDEVQLTIANTAGVTHYLCAGYDQDNNRRIYVIATVNGIIYKAYEAKSIYG